MVTTWTGVPNASGTSWTALSGGKTLFDAQTVLFDDPSVFFNGAAQEGQWTDIANPSGTSWTAIPKAT